MSGTDHRMTSRRHFLAGSGALALAPVHSVAALDAGTTTRLQQHLQNGEALVLYRSGNPAAECFAATFASAGIETVRLQPDMVRQWRAGLGERFVQRQQLLVGLGDWSDYSLLRGLAAEARRYPLLELRHAAPREPEWAETHALDLLRMQASDSAALTADARTPASHFTWIIG